MSWLAVDKYQADPLCEGEENDKKWKQAVVVMVAIEIGMVTVKMAIEGHIMIPMGGQVAVEAGPTQGMREMLGAELDVMFQEGGLSVSQLQ